MSLGENTLYYGDCLEWLPRFPSESVDLIYLDPPFNSNTNYNLLFGNGDQKRRNGGKSAQVRAFDDTWRWDDSAAKRVARLSHAAAHPAHKAVVGLRTLIGEGGMLAYLSYMAERLAEMPRVLKPTGSIYLHCDPTASHGLKLVMDCVFGAANFRNEIVWKRAHRRLRLHSWENRDRSIFGSAPGPMRFADDEKTVLAVNEHVSLRGIPASAHTYQVNGRTPLAWFIDRYRIKQDRESGIVNDPNAWFDDPRELIAALRRIVHVSVETARIVTGLPEATDPLVVPGAAGAR